MKNLIAKLSKENEDEVVTACVPDLISIVDTESGEPIPTEDVRYGLRVSVLVLPASRMLTTNQALQVVGPKAFGYDDVEFTPKPNFNEEKSVIRTFSKI